MVSVKTTATTNHALPTGQYGKSPLPNRGNGLLAAKIESNPIILSCVSPSYHHFLPAYERKTELPIKRILVQREEIRGQISKNGTY